MMDEKEPTPETPGECASQASGDSSNVIKSEDPEVAPEEVTESMDTSEPCENVSSDVKLDSDDVVDSNEEPKQSDSELRNHVDGASVTDAENKCESEKFTEDASTPMDEQEDSKKDGM